jgi:glutamate dehydrogenase
VFGGGIDGLKRGISDTLDEGRKAAFAARQEKLVAAGVPEDLAAGIAGLADLRAGLDLVRIAQNAQAPIDTVARCYFAFGARLGFDWLRETAAKIPAQNAWQVRAVAATVDDLYSQQAELVGRALAAHGTAEDPAAAYLAVHAVPLARYEALVVELRASGAADLAALTVAGRELRALVAG